MFDLAKTLHTALGHHQAGRLQEAERLYLQVLAAAPAHPDALHLLGLLRHHQARHEEAVALISGALSFRKDPGFYSNRGEAYRALTRLDEAVADFRRAISIAPQSSAAHNNLGLALKAQGKLPEAEKALRRAITVKSAFPEAHNNLGSVLHDQKQLDVALLSFAAAIDLRPDYWEAYNNQGLTFQALGRKLEAKDAFEKAIALEPSSGQAHYNLGNVLVEMGDYRAAAPALMQATVLTPNHPESFNNLANCLAWLGDVDKALAYCQRAIKLNPVCADAHRGLGAILLSRRSYPEGWREHEWRWQSEDFVDRRRPFGQPLWTGDHIASGTLLVWGEQGVGDEILFAGMMLELAEKVSSIVWEVEERLVPLLQRACPKVDIVGRKTPPDPTTVAPTIVAQIPAGNLGRYLRPGLESFPGRRRYLQPDACQINTYREKLRRMGERIVGISWISTNIEVGAHKTTRLADWAEVLRADGLRFINLQYGETSAERAALKAEAGIEVEHIDDLDLWNDLDRTAALVATCDLVITVSNTTAHLAGALAIPTWVLVSAGAGKLWYWGEAGETTPWYPSARIFRQTVFGQWRDVFARVALAIRQFRTEQPS